MRGKGRGRLTDITQYLLDCPRKSATIVKWEKELVLWRRFAPGPRIIHGPGCHFRHPILLSAGVPLMTLLKPARSFLPLALVGGLLLFPNLAQGYVIVFKDGFMIQGRVQQDRMFIFDKVSGKGFSVPVGGTPYWVETYNTNVTFSPSQIHDILDEKPRAMPPWMHLKLYPPTAGDPMPIQWSYTKIGDWNQRWERDIEYFCPVPKPHVTTIKHRITDLTPYFIRVGAEGRAWAPFYHPSEFGPEAVRNLLDMEFTKVIPSTKELKYKDLTKIEKHIKISQFLAQSGWVDQAEKELKGALNNANQTDKSKIESELAFLAKVKAVEFVSDLELAFKLGRYKEVSDRLAFYAKDKLAKLVGDETDLRVFEIREGLGKQKSSLVKAQQFLVKIRDDLTGKHQAFFKEAANGILKELNYETLDRLATFMPLAEAYELAIKEKSNPAYTPEQMLSFAISGWLLGKNASEENVEVAQKLWEAREFVSEYQNNKNALARKNLRDNFQKNVNLSMDLLARVIKMVPPPAPHQNLTLDIQQIVFPATANSPGGTYHLQLPPEYHHLRPFPVLVVLHDGSQTATQMLKAWSVLAAKNGYILVAPEWTRNGNKTYGYSEDEQYFMMDLLKDLRKRFQVDSDRVFLFGAGEGGLMAFDVGLAHPDQFAGVLPMSALPQYHSYVCRTNAQYLPFYVISGTMNILPTKELYKLFKDSWIPGRYPVLWVEYKGRGHEWFGGELPTMIDWMNRKKRYFPLRQVGVVNTGVGKGEEFCTLRQSDNHFYWLSTNKLAINPPKIGKNWNANWTPPTLAATIYSGNQIQVHAKMLGQVSIWVAPGMIEFDKKVEVKVNGNKMFNEKITPSLQTMMEDFYEHGDRQRLFLAKIDLGG